MDDEIFDAHEAEDMFPLAQECLPRLFAEESLYSWCARYHRLNGGNNPKSTCRQLFGHPTAALRPELPFFLGRFQKNAGRFLGSLDDILKQRTVLGFYAAFLKPSQVAYVSNLLSEGSIVAARAFLGGAKDGRATRSSLYFCRECAAEQLSAYSISWWHTTHMWPTVGICQRHDSVLLSVKDEFLSGANAGFFLVHELDASQVRDAVAVTGAQLGLLRNIAKWTMSVVLQANNGLDESVLRYTYLLGARQRNWLSLNGDVRIKALQESLVKLYGPLSVFPEFGFVSSPEQLPGGFVARLFRNQPGRRHPSKHLTLMSFLFSEPEEFFDRYRQVEAVIGNDGQQGADKLITDSSRRLVELVEQSGCSVTAAAETIGIAPQEALAHLNRKRDVRRPRCPRIVGTPRENMLRQMLEEGKSQREIAEVLSLRKGFINCYLAQDTSLKVRWEKERFAEEAQKRRAQFLSLLDAYPGLSMRAIRQLPGNSFQWLYKHDKEWLRDVLPAIWRR